ncbi:MAG: CapA family protein, partial [Sandaracinaceae bacterium]|nr:CapA family protein [Sandaracinaceae bacterium]
IASALSDVGVDVVSVANNHAYDQGAQGMLETLAALARAQVASIGAAADAARAAGPHIAVRGGVRVAFVAFTERINRGPAARGQPVTVARFDRALAADVLARARAQADLVVLSIHWSHDFVPGPLIAQRRLARELVALGADVILGHGPHVLQEVERLESPRGEAICAYSLGNLVSNQGLRWTPGRRTLPDVHPAVIRPETRDGVWLRVRARVGERIDIDPLEAVPLWTHNSAATRPNVRAPVEIRLMPLTSADPRIVAERRPAIARALGRAVTLTEP